MSLSPAIQKALEGALRESTEKAMAQVMERAREAELSRLYWTGVGRTGYYGRSHRES